MSKGNGEVMSVKILLDSSGSAQGKLAHAEAVFGAASVQDAIRQSILDGYSRLETAAS